VTRQAARFVAGASLLGTLLVAAGHTIYYLYYWEWIRAQIAATFTVAALVIGAAWLILLRLDRLEQEVLRLGAQQIRPLTPATNRPTGLGSADDSVNRLEFPWLDSSFAPTRHRAVEPLALAAGGMTAINDPSISVFIPVLLGAGLLASAAAGVIERTATAVHRPPVDRIVPERAVEGRRHRAAVLGTFVLAGMAALVIPGLWWSAHYAPEPWREGQTEMTVQVSSRSNAQIPVAETVEVTARFCTRNAIEGVRVERVLPDTADTAKVIVSPHLDEQAQRRLRGCLIDATLFRHRMTVTGTVLVPASR
jgi:hypothetical protein